MEYFDILHMIGNTPVLRLAKISALPIFAKAEYLNPGGSAKDRVAKFMISQAEKGGPLAPAGESLTGSVNRARELAGQIEGAHILGQFENPDNPEIYYRSTGVELWQQLDGQVDAFVAGIGSGGSLGGIGRFLKEQNPAIEVVAVEPANAAAWGPANGWQPCFRTGLKGISVPA